MRFDHASRMPGQYNLSDARLNWRRELLLLSMAGMEVSWLAGWTVILLDATRTAGLTTAWISTFVVYVLATSTARTLIRRRTRRSDQIIGGLVLVSTLVYLKFNLYPAIGLFDPGWLGTLARNIASGLQKWPRELTGLLIGFFIWFRGLRLPRRHIGTRTMLQHLQIGLMIMVVLAIAATGFPVSIGGAVAAYFAAGLLSLALTRIEETARAEEGAVSPFGRKWLMTLIAALLVVGMAALIGRHILTVEMLRTLLRPLAIATAVVFTAFALLLSVLVQYLLFPLIVRILGDRIPLEDLNLQPPEPLQQAEGEGAARVLLSPALLNALRVVGLFLLTLIALWLVVRSFRRWRVLYQTDGGIRETAMPAGSLADDVMAYLRDQWRRLRDLADLRRLLQLRGVSSVRAIYANLLMLMAAANHPRRAGQTPYEFEPTVDEVLPAREAEIHIITAAYVRARYGGLEPSDEELRKLRRAWRRIQADGEKLLEGKPVVKRAREE